jgi:hypothetical protein
MPKTGGRNEAMKYWGCSSGAPLSPNRPSNADLFKVSLGDCPGGSLEHGDVTVEDTEKGHCFDEMWGIKGKDNV